MILDFEYKAGRLIISEVNDKGDIILNYYDWKNPHKFVPCYQDDPARHKRYQTWDKKPVKLVPTTRPNRFACYEYIDALPAEELERLHTFQTPKIFYMDIETEILPTGFVEPVEATSRVLTLAIVYEKTVMVLGLKPLSNAEQAKIKSDLEDHFKKFNLKIDFKYKCFAEYGEDDEFEMLRYVFEKLIPRMPVITGWNFTDYDWTFLVNRCRRIGIKPEQSSFTGKIEKIFNTDIEVPAHRLIVDYMAIYKKWDTSVKVKESNSLDWVGEKLVGVKKVHYDGNLQDLYDNDFAKYVFYNAADTILVQLIHEKTRLMDIMFAVANLAKIRLCDFSYKNLDTTLVATEGFLRNDFRSKKNIVLCKDNDVEEVTESIEGGYVKKPNKGMNNWVVTYDFASLYPTIQRQFNIAPENFKGIASESNPGFADWDGVLSPIMPDDIVCNNGAVFSREESVTVNFLADVYKQRKQAKGKMNDSIAKQKAAEAELQAMLDELAQLEAAA